MNKTLCIAAISTIGLFAACKSSNSLYKEAESKQYETIYNNKNIIDKYGVSTLKPNGKLSSIEGKDVLYFLTEEDSIAYDNVNKFCNGLLIKVQNENRELLENITNNYTNSKIAANEYYKTAMKNNTNSRLAADLHFNYNKSMESIEQNETILTTDARKSYAKKLNKAQKLINKIRSNARSRMLGVFVR